MVARLGAVVNPSDVVEEEAARVRQIYAERRERGAHAAFHPLLPTSIIGHAGMLLAWSRALADRPVAADGPVLELGCGRGAWLRQMLDWGLPPEQAHGIDLLTERIEEARALAPATMDLREGNGLALPYADAHFGIVYAQTVFSSILDPDLRRQLAGEMTRVVKPEGRMLVFDFRYDNPRNRNVTRITAAEIRRLFPGKRVRRWTLTLVPPLARRLTPLCPWLALAIERLCPPLRSHALYLIEGG